LVRSKEEVSAHESGIISAINDLVQVVGGTNGALWRTLKKRRVLNRSTKPYPERIHGADIRHPNGAFWRTLKKRHVPEPVNQTHPQSKIRRAADIASGHQAVARVYRTNGHARHSIQWLMRFKPAWFRHDLLTLLDLLKERKINPLIAQRLPLEEARRAHEMLGEAECSARSCCCRAASGTGLSGHRSAASSTCPPGDH